MSREPSVTVDQQLVCITGQAPRLDRPKTATSGRTLPMTGTVHAALSAHLAEFPVTHPWGLIFTDEDGQPLDRWAWAAIFRDIADRAGLPKTITYHSLRHYYVSALIRGGANIKEVQARVGHASAQTTLDTYAHLWPDADERTRAAVEAALTFNASEDDDGTTGVPVAA